MARRFTPDISGKAVWRHYRVPLTDTEDRIRNAFQKLRDNGEQELTPYIREYAGYAKTVESEATILERYIIDHLKCSNETSSE